MFYYVLDLVLPTWSLSQVFALLCFAVGSWFTGLLASNLIKDSGKKKYSELVFLLSGIFYITTLWTVWVYYLNMFPYISQFGFLPLLIWSIYRLIKNFNWKNALITFLCSIVFTSTCVIATLFVVDILVIFFFTLIFAIFHSKGIKEIIKKTFLTILLFICTQLFWILPFVHYTINVSGDIVDSYSNQSVTTSMIDLEKEALGPLDSARMYTRVLETTDDNTGEKYLFNQAEDYMIYDFYKFIGLIPAILGILALVFAMLKKKWTYWLLGVLAIGSWFVIKNQNQPLGFVYRFLQEYIPLFKQVFRWPSSKVGQIYVYAISLLAPVGLLFMFEFLTSFFKKRFFKILIGIVALSSFGILQYFFSSYLFSGDLFIKRGIVDVPSEYYKLQEYLDENDSKGRILYLPTANNGYFREYDWGFVGSGFLHYIVPNPLMDLSLSIGSGVGEDAMWKLRNLELAHDVEGIKEFADKYDVKYILIDRNLVQGRYGYEIDWTTSDLLSEDLPLLWNDSDITLFETDNEETKVSESYSDDINTFSRTISQAPTITPLNMDLTDLDTNNGNIEGSFKYTGTDTYEILTYSDIDIYSLPSSVVIKGNQIIVKPAILTIDNIDIGISKTFSGSQYDFFLIDNQIFSRAQLLEGISLDAKYSAILQIYGIYDRDWNIDNMTSYLANNGKAGNCSGSKFEENIEVKLQGLASGFSIEGKSELPCMYSSVDLFESGIAKININWENITEDTYIGYCLYSSQYGKCLNSEKYIYSNENIGEKEILLPYRLNKNDNLTLTIYAYSPTLDKVETIFRDIKLSTTSNISTLNIVSEDSNIERNGVLLENGKEYTVSIPVIYGDSSYVYLSSQKEDLTWQINEAQGNTLLEVVWDEGIKQVVQGQYLNQYTTLFNTKALEKYLWYWKGENISNIPSTLCLTYATDDKCWVEDLFRDNQEYSTLNFFKSIGNQRLDFSFRSVSYSDISENTLNDIIVMKYPSSWEEIKFTPESVSSYTEYELESIGSSSQGTIYVLKDRLPTDSLITIPQSSSNGWLGIATSSGFPKILNERRLLLMVGNRVGIYLM